jgi:DNA sulfur modification protein DndD
MTTIRLLGWSAQGFRCPDHRVTLQRSERTPYTVSLLQMPNGTGKTTTLELLRAALSGRTSWPGSDLAELKGRDNETGTGRFIVELLVDDRRMTIELTANFSAQSVSYRTTLASSVVNGFRPPAALKRIFSEEFVPFFVFDGELAVRLLEPNQTRAEQALDAQFQLSLLQRVSTSLGQYWTNQTKNVTATQTKGLTQRRNRLDNLEARERQLKAEHRRLSDALAKAMSERDQAQQAWDEAFNRDKEAREQRDQVTGDLARAETNLGEAIQRNLAMARDPHALSTVFATSLQALKANLDKLKLPESAAKEFFDDLAEADQCVCGEVMTQQRRAAILERKAMYLGQDDVGVLNSIKGDIKDLIGEDAIVHRALFDKQLAVLEAAVRERDDLATELTALEAKRLAEGDEELAAKKRRLDDAEGEIDRIRSRLDVLDAEPEGDEGDDTECLKALRGLIAKAGKQLAEVTRTVEIKNRVTLLQRLLAKAVREARTRISADLVEATNAQLAKILPRSPIRVSEIRQSIVLDGQSRASQGQTLALGYAFLLALFDSGQLSLPFVVDSPTGALDLRVRREVAELLPSISPQMVAFTTSSETDQFVPVLHEAAGGDVQYLTLFRLNDETRPLLASIPERAAKVVTDNGVLVTSRQFFESFDTGAYDEAPQGKAA